jgi:hypothetical protein
LGFVTDKVALEQVFSEHFGFPCQSFNLLRCNHHHPSTGAGKRGKIVGNVPSGLSLISPKEFWSVRNKNLQKEAY